MKIFWYITASVMMLISTPILGEEKAEQNLPRRLSLKDSCVLALKNNPQLNSSKEQAEQQNAQIKQAKALRNPKLTATGNYETYDNDRLQSFGAESDPDSTRWNGAIEAKVTVFSGGRNYQRIKTEQARLRSIESDITAREEDLLVLVHKTYFDAWLADEKVKVQNEAVSVLEEQLRMAKSRFDAGAGEKYDVTQAEVSLANERPPLIRAKNDRRRSIDLLQEIIGLSYPEGTGASDIHLDPLPSASPLQIDLDNAVKAALESRPEMRSIEFDMTRAHRQLLLVKRENAPIVDLFAGYGIESDIFGLSSSLEGWSTGVRLNWTLIDGGIRRGKVEQAQSQARQVKHQATEIELLIAGEVRKAYYDQLEASAILEASAKVIDQAEEALLMAQNRYKAGNGTQLEVLESQLQLTRARLEHSIARHDLELASIMLKRAVGTEIIKH